MLSRFISLYLILICFSVLIYCNNDDEYTLELVQAVFRHGSRTPDPHEMYPNDPYTIDDYIPSVYGQLTPRGKIDAFALGELLRRRYKTFLEVSQSESIVETRSTEFERTKKTLSLVLEGLFPRNLTEAETNDLTLSPIPNHFAKLTKDYVLWSPLRTCPAYARELARVFNSSEVDQFVQENDQIIDHVEQHSGRNMSIIRNLFFVSQTLDAEAHMGLRLPQWASEIYPSPIKRLATHILKYELYNPRLQRLFSGRHMKVITNNMVEKSRGSLLPADRKLFLYSGHDSSVVGPLIILDLFQDKFPNYCSAVLFELYRSKVTQEYFVKVLHVVGVDSGPEEKVIPGCDLMCPLSKFETIVQPYLPGNLTEECESDVLLE